MSNSLVKRFLVSFGVLLLTQLGTFLPIPGLYFKNLDSRILENFNQININLIGNWRNNKEFFLGLFSLSIFPYLKATLFLQLLINLFPGLKIKNFNFYWDFSYYIRFLTLGFSVFQTIKIVSFLKPIISNWDFFFSCEISLWLISGSMIILWLNEIITEYGLGNGISLFLYLQILSNLSESLQQFFVKQNNFYRIISTFIFFLISLYGIVFIEQGIKKIPLIVSKSLTTGVPVLTLNYNYIPLRFNQAGIIPILLTVFILNIIFHSKLPFLSYKIFYFGLYFLFIIYFSIFYSALVLDFTDLSSQFQKRTGSVLGLKPGFQTSFFLKQTVERITLIGSIILAIFAIVLNILEFTFNTIRPNDISITTYLLISIGIFLDLMREIENIYFFSAYN